MQYSFALAALAAVGANAAYQVEAPPAAASSSSAVVASSSAVASSSQAYPVAPSAKSSTAAVSTTPAASQSTPAAATYPVVATGNGTTISSQVVKYTTEVVNQYTTYCPGPTQITYGTKTYTVTAPTTLTITDCPCTVSKPVFTTSAVKCSTCTGSPAVPSSGVPVPVSLLLLGALLLTWPILTRHPSLPPTATPPCPVSPPSLASPPLLPLPRPAATPPRPPPLVLPSPLPVLARSPPSVVSPVFWPSLLCKQTSACFRIHV